MTMADRTLTREWMRGLRAWVDGTTGRGPHQPLDMAARVRLDILGLGLGQALGHLHHHRPDYDSFEAWVAEIAGPPDPDAIARYHAWLDGAPPPEATQHRFDAIAAMPDVLSPADIRHWDEHGYVILRQAVSADEAAAMASIIYETVGARPDDPASWYAGENTIMIERFQGPGLDAARKSPRVHKAFAQLWGTPDLWTIIDRLGFNPPVAHVAPGLGIRRHWDVSLVPPIPFATQAILYLTDTAPDQGALELAPGFHRRIDAWLAEHPDDPRAVDLSGETIFVGGNAGDLVIWHQALPHGASPNCNRVPRLVQYVNMYSADMVHAEEWR
jgi:ectoine hydroxylase-related dioxygenase (phytanoyl-CoA dioxygenase family)